MEACSRLASDCCDRRQKPYLVSRGGHFLWESVSCRSDQLARRRRLGGCPCGTSPAVYEESPYSFSGRTMFGTNSCLCLNQTGAQFDYLGRLIASLPILGDDVGHGGASRLRMLLPAAIFRFFCLPPGCGDRALTGRDIRPFGSTAQPSVFGSSAVSRPTVFFASPRAAFKWAWSFSCQWV